MKSLSPQVFSRFILALCSISIVFVSKAQERTLSFEKKDYTLVTIKAGHCFYQIENRLSIERSQLAKLCSPGILKQASVYTLKLYHDKEKTKLYSVAKANGACYEGGYKAYHSNGKLSVQGSFMERGEGNCNLKTGTWEYFDQTGKLIRTEEWKEGEFVGIQGLEPTIPYRIDFSINDKPYKGKEVSLAELKTLNVQIKSRDRLNTYGRYIVTLLVTGDKFPLKDIKVDYSNLKYFDVVKFMEEYRKPGSNLIIKMTDTKTDTYFSTEVRVKD